MRRTWDEIDVLRGFAAVLMVVNHAGVAWYGDEPSRSTVEGLLVYLGSFAPVSFFLLTGIGYGVAPLYGHTGAHRYGLANKVGILIVADLLLAWHDGFWLGLNFLGFIGVSTLVLEKLRATKHPIRHAFVLAGFVLFVRFVAGPPLLRDLGPFWGPVAGWLTGAKGIDGLAYSPFPWLFYPLFGYVLGRLAQRSAAEIRAGARVVDGALVLVAILAGVVAFGLSEAGRPSFRWGVMTIAFFVQSLLFVAVSLLVVLVGQRNTRVADLWQPLHLRGVSSLAVVPIHYAVLAAIGTVLLHAPPLDLFVLCAGAACFVSLAAARQAQTWITRLAALEHRAALWQGLVLLSMVSGLALFTGRDLPDGLSVGALVVGQLALCALLVVRRPAPVEALRPAPRH